MHIVKGDGGGPIRLHPETRLARDELFDALMRLADCWQKKWDRRRSLEWKVTSGIWVVAAIGFVAADAGSAISLALPAVIVLVHAYVLVQIRLLNEADGCIVLQLRREAEALTHRFQILPDVPTPKAALPRIAQAFFHYSVVIQVTPTAVAAVILTQKLWNMTTI